MDKVNKPRPFQRFSWPGTGISAFGDSVAPKAKRTSEPSDIQFWRRVGASDPDTEKEYAEISGLIFNNNEYEIKRDREIHHVNSSPFKEAVGTFGFLETIISDIKDEFTYLFSGVSDPMIPYTLDNVRRTALTSRIILFILQILASLTLPHHVNDGFKTPMDPNVNGVLDAMVNSTLGGLSNWDGQYFLHVATKGYTHENTMAFFPLFPFTVGYLAKALHLVLFPVLTLHSVTLLTGLIFNLWCFQNAALTLSQIVLIQAGDMAQYILPTVTFIFCYNPASIFFSAFYSESLFALLTFNCILELYQRNLPKAIIFASLGCICRSNGLLNFGLIAVAAIAQVASEIRSVEPENSAFPARESAQEQGIYSVKKLVKIASLCLIGISPFLCFQAFCVIRFCSDARSSSVPEFCLYDTLPYTYIQKVNWNVGFLQYFELKQIPNFILALPVLLTLGIGAKRHATNQGIELLDKLKNSRKYFYWDVLELTLACHGIFLTLFCLSCIHVQVSTRLIMSSCPYLYIYIANKLTDERVLFLQKLISWMPFLWFIQIWFSMYFLVGTVGFSLGLPWT